MADVDSEAKPFGKATIPQDGGYREELENELKSTDPNSHANRLITQEIARLSTDEEKKDRPIPWIEIHSDRPQKTTVKVRVPIKEHPRFNFVGKLLGPKAQTLKSLQEQTGCKLAIMGRGSMRDKNKEEELRKEGGKYAHLNEDLHVFVECFTVATDGYHRIGAALTEIRKYLIPEMADMLEGGDMGMGGMGMNGSGAPRGRGGFRGGPPPDQGGRGGFRGGRGRAGPGGPGAHAPPQGGRGAPGGRGGAPRGAPPGRGGVRPAPPAAAATYDDYSSQGYGTQYDATSYDDGYSAGGGDASYYDYSNTAGGYDQYPGNGGGYEDYGNGYTAKAAPAPPSSYGAPRGAARGARSHPYSRGGQSGY